MFGGKAERSSFWCYMHAFRVPGGSILDHAHACVNGLMHAMHCLARPSALSRLGVSGIPLPCNLVVSSDEQEGVLTLELCLGKVVALSTRHPRDARQDSDSECHAPQD